MYVRFLGVAPYECLICSSRQRSGCVSDRPACVGVAALGVPGGDVYHRGPF